MRELIYYVASTLDGFIAQDDGSLSEFPWDDQYGAHLLEHFPETFPVHLRGDGFTKGDNRYFDAVLMGRRTYEVGLREGVACPYPTMDQYVFSRSMQSSPDRNVHVVGDDAINIVKKMKLEGGRAIWLCGGGDLGTSLLSAGLIDRLILKLNPILFGSGIPMFRDSINITGLTLEEHHAFDSGHMILRYAVKSHIKHD